MGSAAMLSAWCVRHLGSAPAERLHSSAASLWPALGNRPAVAREAVREQVAEPLRLAGA